VFLVWKTLVEPVAEGFLRYIEPSSRQSYDPSADATRQDSNQTIHICGYSRDERHASLPWANSEPSAPDANRHAARWFRVMVDRTTTKTGAIRFRPLTRSVDSSVGGGSGAGLYFQFTA
jgi:hypothetical protein